MRSTMTFSSFLPRIMRCRRKKSDLIQDSSIRRVVELSLSSRIPDVVSVGVAFPRRFASSKSSSKKDHEKQENSTDSIWIQARSPPNIITITRMASTPLLAYWIVHEDFWLALGGCTIAAASDYMDGYLAKEYGWSTILGTYLDPLADKVFVNTLGVSLWYVGILPTPLVALWAVKDILLLSGTAAALYKKNQSINFLTNSVAREPLKVTPSMIAKVNTTFQFATLGAGIVSPLVAVPPFAFDAICYLTGTTTIASVLSYASMSGLNAGNFRQGDRKKE